MHTYIHTYIHLHSAALQAGLRGYGNLDSSNLLESSCGAYLGLSGTYLGLSEPTWVYLGLFGLIWAYLGLFWAIWIYLGLHTHIHTHTHPYTHTHTSHTYTHTIRKWPIHTYIHGSMPFQRGSIFSCMFTFAHADQGKTPGGAKMLKMGIHT